MITDTIQDRLKNSFMGPFSLAFIVFNWPILLLIFTGDHSAYERIDAIRTHFDGVGICAIAIPFVIAILYIFCLPIVTAQIDTYNAKVEMQKQTKIEKLSAEYDETISNTREMAAKLSKKVLGIVHATSNNHPNSAAELQLTLKYLELLADTKNNLFSEFRKLRESREI